jgi:apolipoprotein N-acyltransferase
MWPMIFFTVPVILISIRGAKFFTGVSVGIIAGFSFYAAQITWISQYLGPRPLLILAGGEGLLMGLFLGITAVVWRRLDARLTGNWRHIVPPFAVGCVWMLRDWIASNYPYGGFPWARLALSQSNSPLSKWVYFGGMGMLTLIIVVTSVLVLESIRAWRRGIRGWQMSPGILAIAILFVVPMLTVVPANAEDGYLTIGGAQGNGKAGLFAVHAPGEILEDHVQATEKLVNRIDTPPLDLLVWPENGSDLSPMNDASANVIMTNLVNNIAKAPVIFGTLWQRGDKIYNSSIMWQPGMGPTDWYDKKVLVPFGEYLPDRAFWYPVAPDLVDMIRGHWTPGTREGIFTVKGKSVGTVICFEVSMDGNWRDLIAEKAEVVLAQTNNADFGKSDEAYQQLAIARLRAIESGRSVVNVSTVGPSAIFAPDGSELASIKAFTRDGLWAKVPMRTSITPAMVIGPLADRAYNLFAIVFVLFAGFDWLRSIRRKRAVRRNGAQA